MKVLTNFLLTILIYALACIHSSDESELKSDDNDAVVIEGV